MKNKSRTGGYQKLDAHLFGLDGNFNFNGGINKQPYKLSIQMDDLILKTIIFILKDKKTNKPVVMTHFQGFENDDEARDFSHYLTDTFCNNGMPLEPDDLSPKRTLH